MIPKTMADWRQDEQYLAAGRRLLQNDDFKALLRTLEGFALLQRDLQVGASEIDVARWQGMSAGHGHILGFIYTMDTLYKRPTTETPEATFGTENRKK